MNLKVAGEYHPHWRMHHAVRVHLWEPEDARAVTCVRPARASLCLRDACVASVLGAWVHWLCARHHLLSTFEHLNAVMVDPSAIGRPGHHQLEHACDTRAWQGLGRVHLLWKRCVRRRGHVFPWAPARVQVLALACCSCN